MDFFKNLILEIVGFLLRCYLWGVAICYRGIPLLKRLFFALMLLGAIGGICYVLVRFHANLEPYLSRLNDNGNNSGFYVTFFTSLGASTLGILGIAFALTLFALEQAAEKHTQRILDEFVKDKPSKRIFWGIAFIALIFFIFAFLPCEKFILWSLSASIFLFFLILLLLRWQYQHIIEMINPLSRMRKFHNDSIKALDKIDRHLNLLIRAKVIRPGPQSDDE